MARIKMHIPKARLPFYPPCEVKCRLQNGVSTLGRFFFLVVGLGLDMKWAGLYQILQPYSKINKYSKLVGNVCN